MKTAAATGKNNDANNGVNNGLNGSHTVVDMTGYETQMSITGSASVSEHLHKVSALSKKPPIMMRLLEDTEGALTLVGEYNDPKDKRVDPFQIYIFLGKDMFTFRALYPLFIFRCT